MISPFALEPMPSRRGSMDSVASSKKELLVSSRSCHAAVAKGPAAAKGPAGTGHRVSNAAARAAAAAAAFLPAAACAADVAAGQAEAAAGANHQIAGAPTGPKAAPKTAGE